MDVKVLNNFLEETDLKSQTNKLASTIDDISVFTPGSILSIIDKKYAFILEMDLNRISNSEKKKLQSQIQQIATNYSETDSKDFYFYFKTTNLKDKTHNFSVIDNQSQNIRIAYKNQNTKKTIQKKLEEIGRAHV